MCGDQFSQGPLHEAVGVECSQCWIGLSSTELFPFVKMMPLLTGTSKDTLSEYQSFIYLPKASFSVSWWIVGVVIPACTQHVLLIERKYKAEID